MTPSWNCGIEEVIVDRHSTAAFLLMALMRLGAIA
jgi:hypothetical protein